MCLVKRHCYVGHTCRINVRACRPVLRYRRNSEGNLGNSNDDVIDVVPPVASPLAPEYEAAAEPAQRGPVVQELRSDARQPDPSRSLSVGHIAKRTEIGKSSSRSISIDLDEKLDSMPPKRTV